ncbi:MAG: general secretion pathway protein GspK [Comamonadaceae bacterium]|nr:MAG: general secretion pathway protein GspK [Comamonadaceae bacterium]
MRPAARARQRGAALLAAMLTVTLVATLSAAALWQQWRSVEIEAAERGRVQAAWVLIGALDWSRLILAEDRRASQIDSLSEPWALPLEEARLSSFLSAEKNIASDSLEGLPDAFLSGRIEDAQARLNVRNLVGSGKVDPAVRDRFAALFRLLNLPVQELDAMAQAMVRAVPASVAAAPPPAGAASGTATGAAAGATTGTTTGGTASDPAAAAAAEAASLSSGISTGGEVPLVPRHVSQLVWLGLSPASAAALAPYVTVLPRATTLNLNTASAEAISASLPTLGLAAARRMVEQRRIRPFNSLDDANRLIPESESRFDNGAHGVASNYFEVEGRLRLDRTWVEEHSLLWRDAQGVTVLWRERGAGLSQQEVTQRR